MRFDPFELMRNVATFQLILLPSISKANLPTLPPIGVGVNAAVGLGTIVIWAVIVGSGVIVGIVVDVDGSLVDVVGVFAGPILCF